MTMNHIPTMDELATQIRQAIEHSYQAGYLRGQYVGSQASSVELQATMLGQVARADELTAAMWTTIYDLAPAFADALQLMAAEADLADTTPKVGL